MTRWSPDETLRRIAEAKEQIERDRPAPEPDPAEPPPNLAELGRHIFGHPDLDDIARRIYRR